MGFWGAQVSDKPIVSAESACFVFFLPAQNRNFRVVHTGRKQFWDNDFGIFDFDKPCV
jgi:hypothetical protein